MKREELTLDDGLLCLAVNGKAEIIFNPTDFCFIERVFKIFDALDTKQGDMEQRIKAAQPREIFEIANQADTEMREMLDGLLGAGICAELFGDVNVYAYAEGLPLWCNLLFAVMDRCESELVSQQKQTNPRLAKYTAKYQKKA